MNLLERCCVRLRHHPALQNSPVWGAVRPAYNAFLRLAAPKGLERVINGTDIIRVDPGCREVPERYEPAVWFSFMNQVREGDTIVDVGAYIGLYAIAAAQRAGPKGSVIAFEPDPANRRWLQRHIALNRVGGTVRLFHDAVGDQRGEAQFVSGGSSQSHMGKERDGGIRVCVTTLDEIFPDLRVDILKIDVEGFEEKVLRGGTRLLRDRSRSPRLILLEVHPYAWKELGTSGESLLGLLQECGYTVSTLEGRLASAINSYGHLIARKQYAAQRSA